jgi:tetratricopeptide (TPR) repeat protein
MVRLHLDQGDADRGFKLLAEVAGGNSMGPREAQALAETMIQSSYYAKAIDLLKPHVSNHPQDYRLGYLYGIALEEELRAEEAIAVFLGLLDIDQKLPSPKAPNLTNRASTQSYQQRRWESLREEAPSGVVDLLKQTSFDPRRAYAHRHRSRHRQASPFRTPMALPQQLQDVPKHAIPHIAALTQGQNDLLAIT